MLVSIPDKEQPVQRTHDRMVPGCQGVREGPRGWPSGQRDKQQEMRSVGKMVRSEHEDQEAIEGLLA